MEIAEAQKYVDRERSRWFSFGVEVSDEELMRRREELLGASTMILAFFVLFSFFLAGNLGFFGWFVCVFGGAFAARQCGAGAGHCHEVWEFLQAAGVSNLSDLKNQAA
jgi:hypothetical protein